jgi:acetolactate synthase-1/2/3 large subunit
VDLREAARLIDERMPADVSLVTGSGHSLTVTAMVMQKARPLQVVVNSEWGSIGQAMATAIGVGVGLNGKPLLHMEGDGGAMQNIQELDTAARLKVKILFVILNDGAFGAEYHKLKARGKDVKISLNRSPDFVTVAKGFGCRGRLAKTLDDIAVGIDEFLAGEGPMVLDIRISRNVISIPYRRLEYGEDA